MLTRVAGLMLYALREIDARAPGVREEGEHYPFLGTCTVITSTAGVATAHETPNGGVATGEARRSNAWGVSGVRRGCFHEQLSRRRHGNQQLARVVPLVSSRAGRITILPCMMDQL
ncbi:hypothetical protein BJY52DRAFT_1280887 [Lactarius psammicola]|nr:hypothetical protein BJY52DRAFT_1280887 [Lactarius psammicola]